MILWYVNITANVLSSASSVGSWKMDRDRFDAVASSASKYAIYRKALFQMVTKGRTITNIGDETA